jgi:serine/threonine protein kinase
MSESSYLAGQVKGQLQGGEIGRFQILRELGRGAQSVVYLAHDPHLQREVAIKTLYFGAADNQRNQALLDEARAVSTLQHPNIVPIFEMGEHEGTPYLVFELVTGPTLAELIKREGRLSSVNAADLMRQIVDALAKAHAAGIIHRDLKPSNILIDEAGKPRVMDFGIAARLDAQVPKGASVGLIGTPAYMAPEYVEQQRITPQLDIYAAGLLLLEMLSGERVVKGGSLDQMVQQIVQVPVAILPSVAVDDTLASIIAQACAKDPARRVQTATQFKQLLDDYLGSATGQGAADVTDTQKATLEFLMRRMRHKADFPALSESVSAINKLTDSDKESINNLSNTILKDYGLTNKILRLVNSAHFRQAGGGNIATVSRAVMVLGFDAVRNVAITVLLFDHLQDQANARELKEAFLRANLAGMLTRDASRKFMPREAESAYICALFYSLGQMLSQFYFPEEVLEIRKLMLQRPCSEDQAALQVLGLTFVDLGIGIARFWGFPHDIVASLFPLPVGSVVKPHSHTETLRVLAGFGNELCAAIAATPKDGREVAMAVVNRRFAAALPMSDKQMLGIIESAYEEVSDLATALNVSLKQSPFASQVRSWVSAESAGNPGKSAALSSMDGSILADASFAATEDGTPGDTASLSAHAQATLTAGIQDISNALVGDFSLNDILRITLETMYRAMGFQRIFLCLGDARSGMMAGRFGFGPDSNELAKKMKFPMKGALDVFHLAMSKNVDILISDIDDPKIADKIPDWYRQIMLSKTFVLLPLNIKDRPVALIYADRNAAGSLVIAERELSFLKTLRNQALLAIKQSL